MLDQLDDIRRSALAELQTVGDAEALERWRVARLGRNSPLMQIFDKLGQLPKEERPAIGRKANEVKRLLRRLWQKRAKALRQAEIATRLGFREAWTLPCPAAR